MAIRMFRPLPNQEPFFEMPRAKYALLEGGNRSSPWHTEVCRVNKNGTEELVKLRDINIGDKILGVLEGRSRTDIRTTEVVDKTIFEDETLRLTTKRGYELEGTLDHPVMCCPPTSKGYHNGVDADYKKIEWKELKDVPVGWYVRMAYGRYGQSECNFDEQAYFHGVMDGDGSCDCYHYGVMKLTGHKDESIIPSIKKKLDSEGVYSRVHAKKGSNGVSLEWCNLPYKAKHQAWEPKWTPETVAGYIRGLFDTDGCVSSDGKIIFIQKDGDLAHQVHRHLLMFGIRSSLYLIPAKPHQKRPNPTWRLVIAGVNSKKFHATIGLSEERKAEKLKLYVGLPKSNTTNQMLWWDRVRSVEPAGKQEIHSIATTSETYISNGIVSHNSGKTVCAAIQFAAIATDTPITLANGDTVDLRMPWQKGKCLRMYIVAFDEGAIGRTIYRVLFKSKLFSVVTDPITKELRAYDPEKDVNLKPKDSPPLIPRRFIKSIAWNKRAEDVFSKVVIQDPSTGKELAEIYAFSSRGEPQPGDPVDEIWIDERCFTDGYIDEAKARLVDYDGRLTWSSWPDEESEDLLKYIEIVDRAIEKGDDHIARHIVLAMSSNKHLGKKAVAEFLAGCATPEEALARDKGMHISVTLRMYPLFDKHTHKAIIDEESLEDEVSRILRVRDGIPPNTWTKYLVVDPGTTAPAALLCAMPPSELGEYFIPYQEFYPGRADAVQLAQLIKREAQNEKFFKFIIDHRASRQTPMGFGSRVVDEYERAFLLAGLTCHLSKHKFHPGSDDVGGRQMLLNGWMHPDRKGIPRLRIVASRCPNLVSQLTKLKKKVIQKEAKDERKADGQPSDVADALAYFAGSHPRYIFIKPTLEDASPAYQRYMKKHGQSKERPVLSVGTFY